MKKRNSKLLLSSFTLLSLSAIPVAGISSIKNMNSNLTKVDSDLQATGARDITVNNLTIQLNKDYKNLDWYGKNFANTVTEEQLKQLIVPSLKYDVNYGINILTPADQALANGYVEFTVYQIKNNFSGGVTTNPNGSGGGSSTTPVDGRTDIQPEDNISYNDGTKSSFNMKAYGASDTGTVTINGKTVDKKLVWTTKNITGLFLEYKFSFSWNDNEKIGDFLKNTTKTSLTPEDVYTNLISRSKITDILPSDTVSNTNIISFSQDTSSLTEYGISDTDAKRYGIGVVKVDFSSSSGNGNQADNWVNKTVPNQKYLVRGLMPSDNSSSNKEEMKLNISDGNTSSLLSTSFSVDAIKKQNPNFKLPTGASTGATSVTISQFTPSELINALTTSGNGTSNLLDLLTKKTYLNTTSSLPAIYLTYMGKTSFDGQNSTDASTSTQWAGTGLNKMGTVPTVKNGTVNYETKSNPANDSNITKVLATADNANGQLYLNITYNKYNVYQNTMEIGNQTSIIISGLQTDDSESLNNQNLYFQWKSIDQLVFSNAQDVMDLYNNNRDDASYLKSLSNLFFEGSDNAYALDRTVTISVSGTNNLTVEINFPKYGDINGGWVFSNTYTLTGSSASSAGVTFKSQSEVANKITSTLGRDLSTLTPSEVINELVTNNSRGLLNLTDFYTTSGSSNYSALILQNDTNDGIVIEVLVTSGDAVTSKHSYIYNGMAKGTSTSHIYNFAFGAENSDLESGLATLRNIPIDLITKQDVYNYYVSRLPIYSGSNKLSLTMDDFEITKDTGNNSITISINVAIVADGSENGSKTYSNTLKGFMNASIVNNNSNTTMQNLTVPLSISFALAIALIMSGLIVHQVIKRKKLAKSKINLKDIRKSVKK